MAKNILIINSSPRKNGNTAALAKAFEQGAVSQGNTVRVHHLRDMNVKPCLGGYLCREGKGDPCIQKDDMSLIYADLKWCDAVVLAAPLYWWQFNAEMTIVIDRLCAMACTTGIPKVDSVMLLAAGASSEHNFREIVQYYQDCMVPRFGWTDRGMLLADGIDSPGDVENTEFLAQAEALGKSL